MAEYRGRTHIWVYTQTSGEETFAQAFEKNDTAEKQVYKEHSLTSGAECTCTFEPIQIPRLDSCCHALSASSVGQTLSQHLGKQGKGNNSPNSQHTAETCFLCFSAVAFDNGLWLNRPCKVTRARCGIKPVSALYTPATTSALAFESQLCKSQFPDLWWDCTQDLWWKK